MLLWVSYWGFAYMLVVVGIGKATTVLLSWLNERLATYGLTQVRKLPRGYKYGRWWCSVAAATVVVVR